MHPWYHWVAVWVLILSGFAFVVVPEKPLWFVGLLAVLGIGSYYFIKLSPDKYQKEPPS